jgi:hypothetical protein
MGSWEVHSVVGLVSAGEDTLLGGLSLGGGDGLRCCFGMFRVRMGWQWRLGVFYISPRDLIMTPTGSGFGWWRTDARGGRYLCVVAVLRFPLRWIGHEHILLGSTLTPGARSRSARCNL